MFAASKVVIVSLFCTVHSKLYSMSEEELLFKLLATFYRLSQRILVTRVFMCARTENRAEDVVCYRSVYEEYIKSNLYVF